MQLWDCNIMVIKIGWLIEDRIIYSQSTDMIDVDSITKQADFLAELLNDGKTSDVYIIFDSLQLNKFRVNIVNLKEQTQRYLAHPRLKCNVDVTRNIKNQMLGNVVSDMAGIRWTHCQTLDCALQYLQELDDTLLDLNTALFTTFKPLKEID